MPGATVTINSGDIQGWRPSAITIINMPSGTYNLNSAHFAAWRPTTFYLSFPAGTYTFNTADMAAWNPQTWKLMNMPVGGTYTFGATVMRNWTNARELNVSGLGLNQATVDTILFDIYAGRMGYTYATPTLNVGGTNAAPSGVYADEDPPVTGKGAAFELQNDPEAEGFSRWAITFTP